MLLRFVLTAPTRFRFLVLGPAPRCQVARAFAVQGRRGLNRVVLHRRIRGRLLSPGVYLVLPAGQAAALGGPRVAVRVDTLGVHLAHEQPALACGDLRAGTPAFLKTLLGVAGAVKTTGARSGGGKDGLPRGTRLSDPAISLQPDGDQSLLLTGLLIGLVALSALMIGLASIPPARVPVHTVARALQHDRAEVAFAGLALLALAGTLLVLAHFPAF